MSLETNMSDLPIPNRHPVLRRYLKDVLAWHGYVRFLGMPTLQNTPDVPLDDLYVGQSVSRQYLSPENEPAEHDLLNPVQMLLENRCMVVLGDPGSGKSTLINWFAWYLASGFENRLPNGLANALPVPIILRELSLNNVKSFSDLIDAALQRPVAEHLDRETLYNYINNGSVLFLVDGLDELSVESRSIVRNALGEGMENLSQSFFLITSRVVGYEHIQRSYLKIEPSVDDKSPEESAVLVNFPDNLLNQKLSVSWTEENVSTFYIAPFSDKQISQFSFNWYREQMDGVDASAKLLRDQFISSIFSDENTRRLSRTPHLLTMMALIFRKRAHLPNGRAILYDAIAQAYLESIDQARGLKDEYDWQSKKLWLAKVAFEMQLQRSLDTENEELLVDKAVVLDWIKTSIASFQYQVDDQYAEEFLSWIARRSGLLLPRGQDQYAFLHLSFQEYFAAVYIQSQLENPSWIDKEDEDTLDSRVDIQTISSWSNEVSWSQTLMFLFELMSKKAGWGKRIWKYIFDSEENRTIVSEWLSDIHSIKRPTLIDLKWSFLVNRHCVVDQYIHNHELREMFHYASLEQASMDSFTGALGIDLMQKIIVLNERYCNSYLDFLNKHSPLKVFNLSHIDLSGRDDVISMLNGNDKIEELCLTNCSLNDISFLSDFSKLRCLDVGYNHLRSIPDGKYLDGILNFYLTDNSLTDVNVLSRARLIEKLDIRGNGITDFSFLNSLVFLNSLRVGHFTCNDFDCIANKEGLSTLMLTVSDQASLERVTDVLNIEYFGISGAGLFNLDKIVRLRKLRMLDVYNFNAIDWSPLVNLESLRHVFAWGDVNIDNKIIDSLKDKGVFVFKG